MGLTGAALFVYRRRGETGRFQAPGHPWTTVFFVLSCWLVVAATIHRYPKDSAIGLLILALGLPVYGLWNARPVIPRDSGETGPEESAAPPNPPSPDPNGAPRDDTGGKP
jgi:hypothetical protein